MKFFNVLRSNKNSEAELVEKIENGKEKSNNKGTYYLKADTEVAKESISEILEYNKINYSQNKLGWIKCDLNLKLYNFLLSKSSKMQFSITNTEPLAWSENLN